MKRVHVCSYISPSGVSCHNLTPCPVHSRPRNASWSKDRDRKAQHEFRKATLQRDGYRCRRCGHHDPSGKTLDAHHVTPTEGMTLCNSKANGCHAAHDKHAR